MVSRACTHAALAHRGDSNVPIADERRGFRPDARTVGGELRDEGRRYDADGSRAFSLPCISRIRDRRKERVVRLKDKIAVVTGATSGFGRAIALLFGEEGASLVLHGRDAERGAALVDELVAAGKDAVFVPGDVTTVQASKDLCAAVRKTYGRVDVLVLNAGIGVPAIGPYWEVEPEEFDLVFATNVRGVWLGARALRPLIRRGGSIVVMGSLASFVVNPGGTVYSASKGAVLQLARGMARDLAEAGIRVNTLCPGICETPLTRWFIDNAADPVATEAEYNAAAPLARMGTAEEIARAALFLASDESSYSTGASLVCDGGLMIR
jgi:NAD(P)-dependent dehydrogenase (short-subunit alcohol dehydrogenase family)